MPPKVPLGGIKIGFLNVSIIRSPNINKTFTQRFGNVIMLPKIRFSRKNRRIASLSEFELLW